MSVYKIPLITAFIIFPVIAFIFTIPYLIYQYRKYGSIPILRSVIFYSFILYLLCAYFLVILPLPSMEEMKTIPLKTPQLIPFDFIRQIYHSISFQWNDWSSYITLIKNSSFYIAAFNILLTLPFGIYLRYYFECKWHKVLLYSFLLSLFFELTQLTGLYGIYPRAYRLFDVDDLILNTTGALLGCLITPIVSKILPSRKELDEKSFKKGKKVTFFRRALAYCIDFFFLVIMIAIVSIITYNTEISQYALLISVLLYFLLIPILTNGKTVGKMILKLQIVSKKESKNDKIKIVLRYILSYILFYYQFVIIDIISNISTNNQGTWIIKNGSINILRLYFWLNILSIIISFVKKDKRFLYEKLTQTENKSTIEYEETKKEEPENAKEDEDARDKKDK